MKSKNRPLALDKLLEKFFRERGEEQRFRELGVFDAWEAKMGEEIKRNAHPVSINQGRLVVVVRNSVWLTELGFARQKIKSKLNRELGKGTIKDITFRIGQIPEPLVEKSEAEQNAQTAAARLGERFEQLLASIDDQNLRALLKGWLAALAGK